MLDDRAFSQEFSIVAVGTLNPAIFQPYWFAKQNLISEEAAKAAKTEIITPQAAVFSTEGLFFQVIEQRFTASTPNAASILPLRDVVKNTFIILEHTPINAFGFNLSVNFDIGIESEWHRFGHALVPKDNWRQFFSNSPGMRSVVVEGERSGCTARIQIRVAPFESKTKPYSVTVHINEHHSKAPDIMGRLVDSLENIDDFTSYCYNSMNVLMKGISRG